MNELCLNNPVCILEEFVNSGDLMENNESNSIEQHVENQLNGPVDIDAPSPHEEILAPKELKDPSLYINRELSMLQFQRRVFEEASDENNPLLERVKFLSIVASNMDEFFMVRVGGLKMQIEAGVVNFSIDGLSPAEQLAEVRKSAKEIMTNANNYWDDVLLPQLYEEGINILRYEELTDKQREYIQKYYVDVIFPVLTPLAFDPGHPFPHISNLSLSLAVFIQDNNHQEHFARVKVPASIPRLVPLKRSSGSVKKDGTVPRYHYFVMLEEVIQENIKSLFPGMEIIHVFPFRVTRNADLIIQELEADDLLETMEESVKERRFGSVVRLTVDDDMPGHIRQILQQNLDVDKNDVYTLQNPLGLSSLFELYSIDRYDLKYKPYVPSIVKELSFIDAPDKSYEHIFTEIQNGNILLHFPYDSFKPVIEFLRAAARDPDVLAIKQTLYRVGRNSPVVQALLEARRDYGKQVAVLVELKARFDEESNIGWAKVLEAEGVHVVYGLLGLKTHSKIALGHVYQRSGHWCRCYRFV